MKWPVLVLAIFGLHITNGQELQGENDVETFARHPINKAKALDEIQNGIPDVNESHKKHPYPTCMSIKIADFNAPSGMYTIRINENKTIEVFCEMGIQGGGYTFISPKSLYHLTNSELTPLYTDRLGFVLRVRKTDGTQPYAHIHQLRAYEYITPKLGLNDYSGYNPPMNLASIGTPFLYFGFLPIAVAAMKTTQGLGVEGFSNYFDNCDGNPNSQFTLFPNFPEFNPTNYSAPGPFCDKIFSNLLPAYSGRIMPPEMFMFGETHWGGCGCYQQTNQIPNILSFAIGFR